MKSKSNDDFHNPPKILGWLTLIEGTHVTRHGSVLREWFSIASQPVVFTGIDWLSCETLTMQSHTLQTSAVVYGSCTSLADLQFSVAADLMQSFAVQRAVFIVRWWRRRYYNVHVYLQHARVWRCELETTINTQQHFTTKISPPPIFLSPCPIIFYQVRQKSNPQNYLLFSQQPLVFSEWNFTCLCL